VWQHMELTVTNRSRAWPKRRKTAGCRKWHGADLSADMALGTDGVLRSKIIEMKRSGIEMTGFPKCLIFRTLYEVLNVQKTF